MKERLESIKQEAIKQIQASDVPEKLNDVRVKFLGKKGELTAVLKGMIRQLSGAGRTGKASVQIVGGLLSERCYVLVHI